MTDSTEVWQGNLPSATGNFNTMHTFEGDGNPDRAFEINFSGGYISESHVKAYMMPYGTADYEYLDITFVNESTVRLSASVPVGWVVTIYRDTPKDVPLASFTDGALITAASLDRNAEQAIFGVAEMVDRYSATQGGVDLALTVANNAKDESNLAVTIANDAKASAAAAYRAPAGESVNPTPAAADRANKLFAFNSEGQPTVVLPESGSASDVMLEYAKQTGATLVGTPTGTVQSALDTISTNVSNLEVLTGTLRADLADSTGSSLVGHKGATTNTVARTVESKLRERVSVLDYGADPTGVSDSSAAFQKACDEAAVVHVPRGIYVIGTTIVLKKSVTVIGEGNNGNINRAMSFINMNGNIPFMENWQAVGDPNSMIQVHVSKLFIQYNPTNRPSVTAGNSNKIAFNFYSTVDSSNGLEFSSFEDIIVLGAWAAFWDRSGTYMTNLKKFEARDCRYGILKATGTTITLENCYATGCNTGYQFGAMSTVKMINCAIDNCPVTVAGGSQGGAGVHFTDVRFFSIDSLDAEVNRVSTDGSGIASLIHVQNSVGEISGFVGLHNDLVTEGGALGGSVALIRASGNSLLRVDNSLSEFTPGDGPFYTGGGYALTLLADASSKVTVTNSKMTAPVSKGGSPVLMALSQGPVTFGQGCDITGLRAGGTHVYAQEGFLYSPGYTTSKGSTPVTANVSTPIFTVSGPGAYIVTAYVAASGTNYMASAHVIYDGSAAGVGKIISGAFLTLDASGATVTVQCAGTTTVTWAYVKVG